MNKLRYVNVKGENNYPNRWLKGGIALCLSAVVLSGCASDLNKEETTKKDQASTLKILYGHEEYFYQEYGLLFSAVYPNIDIEIIDTTYLEDTLLDQYNQDLDKAFEAFIEKEQPDVIFLPPSTMTSLIEKGKLYNLDPYVAEKSYNVNGLNPGVHDYLKDIGGGQVYGVPTSLSSQALFYNKDLFDQFGLPYPTDQMTWDEVITLANQFPVEGAPNERIFGLEMSWSKDLSDIVNVLAAAEGLNFFDSDTMQMTLDTPAWASTIEQGTQIQNSNAMFYYELIHSGEYEASSETSDPFLEGRLAMKLDSNNLIDRINEAKQFSQDPEDIVQNWDMVTAPVGLQNPDSTGYMYFNNSLAIYADSTNKDAAWTFISYVTGDEFARLQSKNSYGEIPIRGQYFEKDDNRNYTAFYKLKPMTTMPIYTHVPQRFLYEFPFAMQQEFAKLSEDQISIDHALTVLQAKGNELLATEVMTQEELETYWKQQQDNMMPGIITR